MDDSTSAAFRPNRDNLNTSTKSTLSLQIQYLKHLLELWSAFHALTGFTLVGIFPSDNHILEIGVFM
jgi:hypothetical protein